MSHEDERRYDGDLTPVEREALDALRTLPRPAPSDAARQRAREAFLRGDEPKLVADSAPTPLDAAPDSPDRPDRRQGRRAMAWALPLAAVIAALALLVGIYGSQPAETWRVVDVLAPEGVTMDAPVEVGAQLGALAIATGDSSELELQLGTRLRFRLLPGTRIELPEPPGRWFGRDRVLALTAGEIFGTTAGQALGFPLRFETPELSAELVGTTFAVWRTDEGSCVCLWRGSIEVTPRDGETVSLPVEYRYFVFKDGRLSLEEIDGRERMKLGMMHDGGMPASPPGP